MPPIDLHTLRWEAQVYAVTRQQIRDGEPLPPMLMREHVDRGLKLAAAVPNLLAENDALQARVNELEKRPASQETRHS